MLVNSKGVFQTMRQLPKLALVQPSIEEMKYLCLDAPGMRTLKLDVDMDESNTEKKLLEYELNFISHFGAHDLVN